MVVSPAPTFPFALRGWLRLGLIGMLLLVALVRTQLPVGLVQLTAWAAMFAGYREDFAAEDALRLTLSGDDLCGLCLWVKDVQQASDQLPAIWQATQQMPLLCREMDRVELPAPAITRVAWPKFAAVGTSWQDAVEGPPPRGQA